MQELLTSPGVAGACSNLPMRLSSSASAMSCSASCKPLAGIRPSQFKLAANETLRSRSSNMMTGDFGSAPLRGCALQCQRLGKQRGRPCATPRASLVDFLPQDYGYVVLVAASSAILTQWQAIEVSKQRVKADIKYPKMYEDKEDSLFNCYQRAHQNTLESYPAFITLLLINGLGFPKTSTVLGSMWVVGRIFYTLGYYTGEPRNRFKGMWGQLGLYGLIITAGVFGVKQLL